MEPQQGLTPKISSSDQSDCSTTSSGGFAYADYVYMFLPDKKRENVLMVRKNGLWDLPFFYYADSLDRNVDICCRDLQTALGISSSDTVFSVVLEMLGAVAGGDGVNDKAGYTQLMLTECHIDELKLPESFDWKDQEFVSELLKNCPAQPGHRFVFEETLKVLESRGRSVSWCDPRCRFGWYESASSWFVEVLQSHGHNLTSRIIPERVSETSSILKVNSNGKWFYLKSPAIGSRETIITQNVTSLFPDNTSTILGVNQELNAFISRGLAVLDGGKEEHFFVICMEMGRLQLASIPHVAALVASEFEMCGPSEIANKVRSWVGDTVVRGVLRHNFERFRGLCEVLVDMCEQLKSYKIPLTLIHGDLMPHNVALSCRKSRRYIFFDWQYSCVSHPFCDFHEIHDHAVEHVESYLKLWAMYEPLDRAREAYDIARKLGWFLKMDKLLQCFLECNPQKYSFLEEGIEEFLGILERACRS